jgi:hypothetical protein
MTMTLSTAKLIRLLLICVAIAAVALGCAYAVAGQATQHHVAAVGAPVSNPWDT